MTSLAPLPAFAPLPSPALPPRPVSGAAVTVAVLLTALVSAGLALIGLLVLGLSAMCFDGGSSPQASTCAGIALTFSAYAFATLLVPVIVGIAGTRARDRGVFGRVLACGLLAYLPALAAFGWLFAAA